MVNALRGAKTLANGWWSKAEFALGPFVRKIESSPIVQLVAMFAATVGFGVVMYTAVQIWVDLNDRAEERLQRRDDAIERAWSRVLRPASGNTGKGSAITYLFRNGEDLTGLDLSCENIGKWDGAVGRCLRSPILTQVEIDGYTQPGVSEYDIRPVLIAGLSKIDLRDAEMNGVDLKNIIVAESDFRRSKLQNLRMENAAISGDFGSSQITGCRIVGSVLEALDQPPEIILCEVSGSVVPGLGRMGTERLKLLIAWADAPPFQFRETDEMKPPSQKSKFPYGADVLNKMKLCEPPRDSSGEIIPLRSRKPISSITFASAQCRTVTAEYAMRRFPQAYAITDDTFESILFKDFFSRLGIDFSSELEKLRTGN